MPNLEKPTLAWTLVWDADCVTSLTFLGKSRRLAAGNNLGQILLWELPEKPGGDTPKPILRLDGHTNCVSRLASTPDGEVLISSSYDHTIRYWNPKRSPKSKEDLILNASAIADAERRKKNGAKVPPPIPATVGVIDSTRSFDDHQEWILGMELSRDGKTLISGDDGGQVIIRDRESGKVRHRWQVKGWVSTVALSPDEKRACVGERLPLVFDSGRHSGLKLWDATNGTMVKDLSADFKGQIFSSAAFSSDGKFLAVGRGGELDGTNGIVTILEADTGKKVRSLTPGHLSGLTDLQFHPDGKHLASCGRDTQIRIWEVSTGKMISEVGKGRGGQFKDWIHSISWSADGNWLAAGDMAGAVQVWHFEG